MRRCAVLAAALLLAPRPVGAENPRVDLQLPDATAVEAAAALGRAADLPLEVHPGRPPDPGERASFNWSRTTFARALRELCRRFQLQPGRRPAGGYVLYRTLQPAPPAADRPVGLFERDGLRFFARAVAVYSSRRLYFTGRGGLDPSDSTTVTVDVGIDLGDGDADAIAGLDNLSAQDDRGNMLGPDRARTSYSGYWDGAFPDEWNGSITLASPHPRARKLRWLQGDLMAYKSYRVLREEFPLAEGRREYRRELGATTLEVTRPESPVAPGGIVGALTFKLRIAAAPGYQVAAPDGQWTLVPLLIGADGKTFSPFQTSGGSPDGGSTHEIAFSYLPIDQPAAALRFRLVERSQPARLFTFRMAEIPLPGEPAFVERKEPPGAPKAPAAPARPPAQARPFHDPRGGTLTTAVRISGRPAARGTLALGLALRAGSGWSPVRWIDVELGPDGRARLAAVKPGRYRVQRAYRAPAGDPAPSRWHDAVVELTVAAGREIEAPPLRGE